MAPSMGRPKVENPKATQVSARMDADTVCKLEYCMKTLNMTKAEILREGVERMYQEASSKK